MAQKETASSRDSWQQTLILGGAGIIVGLLTSLGVWLFSLLVVEIHVFAGFISSIPANAALRSWATALVPLVGGLAVGLFIYYCRKPVRFGGLAAVIYVLRTRGEQVKPLNGLVEVIAAILSLSVGAPLGSETPSALVGASLGAFLGKRLRLNEMATRAMVVAGSAAGIGALFHAPVAGALFGLEIIASGSDGWLMVFPTVLAAGVTWIFNIFILKATSPFLGTYFAPFRADWSLCLYLVLTPLVALLAVCYVRLLPLAEKLVQSTRLPVWIRPAMAGLLLGVVAIWLPGVPGSGISQVKQLLSGQAYSVWLLVVLLLVRLILTPISLGGGFYGGMLDPAIFLGTVFGLVYGHWAAQVFPGSGLTPEAFALVGMAVMLASSFHAALFAPVIVAEITNDYHLTGLLLFTSIVGYALARRLQPGSAYTYPLNMVKRVSQETADIS